MVKKLSLSLIIFLSGCGFYPVDSGYIDPEFIPYVEEYKKDKFIYLGISGIKKTSITFKTLEVGFDGMCHTTTIINKITGQTAVLYRHIYIDPTIWYTLNSVNKKLLIYHELGHCDLGFNHTDDQTVMNPYGLSDHLFMIQPDYYLDLFFNKGK